MTRTRPHITKDFTREFSVWQQEIEVEANHFIIPKQLGIRCSVFFFHNTAGVSTAYRLAHERKQLATAYVRLARVPGFAEQLFRSCAPRIAWIRNAARDALIHPKKLNATLLDALREALLDIWSAYLVGYNIPRFQQKGILIPKSKTERDNVRWAKRIRKCSEGIYDTVEAPIEKMLAPLLKKSGRARTDWRSMPTDDIKHALDAGVIHYRCRNEFIVDEHDTHARSLAAYCRLRGLKIQTEAMERSNVIRGTTASTGRVIGRVRIVRRNDPKTFQTFKRGEILVALSTSPIFVPIMRKAAGIITDHGGLSSHAAIVSRELNVPCIVGARTATQQLKNGDRIELDATAGVVRKLTK